MLFRDGSLGPDSDRLLYTARGKLRPVEGIIDLIILVLPAIHLLPLLLPPVYHGESIYSVSL